MNVKTVIQLFIFFIIIFFLYFFIKNTFFTDNVKVKYCRFRQERKKYFRELLILKKKVKKVKRVYYPKSKL